MENERWQVPDEREGVLTMKTRVGPWHAHWLVVLALVIAAPSGALSQAEEPQRAGEIELREGLALKLNTRPGRTALNPDPVVARIVSGSWTPPSNGERIELPDGSSALWVRIQAGNGGEFSNLGRGGYVFIPAPSASERVMILEASGHGMVYVNGEPRAGDTYQYGYVH